MYKISVPISFNTITEENASVYIDSAKKSGVYRVFFGGFGDICDPKSILYNDTERLQKIIKIFKNYLKFPKKFIIILSWKEVVSWTQP